MRMGKAAALLLAAALGACAGQKKGAVDAALISDGRDIADAHCAACHAVGSFGDSPNPDAPPFRVGLARHGETNLEEDLIAGMKIAHPMPEFQINPQGVDALIAYLRTIQDKPQKGR